MRIARVGDVGAERPVVSLDGLVWRDLAPITHEIDAEFLARGLPRLREVPREVEGLDEVAEPTRFGPPIARPGKVVGIGLNYRSHAAALGVELPVEPVVFLKSPSTICGPTDPIHPLPGSRTTDYEVELGVVIGARLHGPVGDEQARAAVAGYVLANDVTDRDLAGGGGPWARGKCADTFLPLGPWLVTADEVDAGDIQLTLSVNGEPRQDASTADMARGVISLLRSLADVMTLDPGDLVITGTPAGVAVARPEPCPYLVDGDVVEAAGHGLGRQRSVVASHGRG